MDSEAIGCPLAERMDENLAHRGHGGGLLCRGLDRVATPGAFPFSSDHSRGLGGQRGGGSDGSWSDRLGSHFFFGGPVLFGRVGWLEFGECTPRAFSGGGVGMDGDLARRSFLHG